MSKKIAFLTLANPDVGFGHLNRCLILARSLRAIGVEEKVFLLPPYEGVNTFLRSVNWSAPIYRTERFPKKIDVETCILDVFHLERDLFVAARKNCSTVLIFDDGKHPQIPEAIDGIISTNAISDNSYPLTCKVFRGLKYLLIRPEFLEQSWQPVGDYIVICMGGSDPEQQTFRMARGCAKWLPDRRIVVVEGPGFIRQEDSPWDSLPNLTVTTDPQNLAELMRNSFFAISGAGTMLYEFVTLGVPVACLSLDDAQDKTAKSLSTYEGVRLLGKFDEVEDEEVGKHLQLFAKINSSQKVTPLGLDRPIDGKGGLRLAKDLVAWLESR